MWIVTLYNFNLIINVYNIPLSYFLWSVEQKFEKCAPAGTHHIPTALSHQHPLIKHVPVAVCRYHPFHHYFTNTMTIQQLFLWLISRWRVALWAGVLSVWNRATSGWRTRSWVRKAAVSRRSWKSCRPLRSGWAARCLSWPSVILSRPCCSLSFCLSVCLPAWSSGQAVCPRLLSVLCLVVWGLVLAILCLLNICFCSWTFSTNQRLFHSLSWCHGIRFGWSIWHLNYAGKCILPGPCLKFLKVVSALNVLLKVIYFTPKLKLPHDLLTRFSSTIKCIHPS